MKTIYSQALLAFFVLHFSSVLAQSQTIDFTLLSDKVEVAGNDTPLVSTIKKTGNTLTWTQYSNGTATGVTHFTITQTSGNWNAETSRGNISYTTLIEGYRGSLALQGQESGITAVLTLMISDTHQEQYSFVINSITYP